MSDMRDLKRLLADVFDEHPVHYTEVDMLGEDAKEGHWGADPSAEMDITLDPKSASKEKKSKTRKSGHGKDRDRAMVNIARGFEVNIHKSFDKYNEPDKNPKKTDGARSVLPEHEDARIKMDTQAAKPNGKKPTHGPDSPQRIRDNFRKMARDLKVDFVADFEDYTEVKSKKTDGEKSPVPVQENIMGWGEEDLKRFRMMAMRQGVQDLRQGYVSSDPVNDFAAAFPQLEKREHRILAQAYQYAIEEYRAREEWSDKVKSRASNQGSALRGVREARGRPRQKCPVTGLRVGEFVKLRPDVEHDYAGELLMISSIRRDGSIYVGRSNPDGTPRSLQVDSFRPHQLKRVDPQEMGESLADTEVEVTGYGQRDPNFADDPDYKIVIKSMVSGKSRRYRDLADMKKRDPRLYQNWPAMVSGESKWMVVRDDTQGEDVKETQLNESDYDTFWIIAADYDGNRGMYEVSPGYRQWVFTLEYGDTVDGLDNAMVSDRAGPNEVRREIVRDLDFVSEPFTTAEEAEEVFNDELGGDEELYDAWDMDKLRELSGLPARVQESENTGHITYLADILRDAMVDGEVDLEVMGAEEIAQWLDDELHYDRVDSHDGPEDSLPTTSPADVQAALDLLRKDEDMLVPPHQDDVEEAAPLAVAAAGALTRGAATGAAKAVGSMAGRAAVKTAANAMSGGSQSTNETTMDRAARAAHLMDDELSTDAQDIVALEFQNEDAYIYFMDRFEDYVDYLDGDVVMPAAEQGTIEQYMTDAGYKYLEDWSFVESIDEDFQNGYDQHHEVDADDLFPSGATSPAQKRRGPGGDGDNRLFTRPKNSSGSKVDESALIARYEQQYRALLENTGWSPETAARELLNKWQSIAHDITWVDYVDAEELVMTLMDIGRLEQDLLGYVGQNTPQVIDAVKKVSGHDQFEAGGASMGMEDDDPWNF